MPFPNRIEYILFALFVTIFCRRFGQHKIFGTCRQMCYKVSGTFLVSIGVLFSGCSDSTLTTCPIILNPLNAGQQIKLIPNQKVNEYAIALICSSNTPEVVGGSKRCLTQVEDGAYITALFQTCPGASKNAVAPTIMPTAKGQVRPIVNTNSPFNAEQLQSTTTPPTERVSNSPPSAPVIVQSNSPSGEPQQPLPPTESTTVAPEVTEPVTEPPSRLESRVTLELTHSVISETTSISTETITTTTTTTPAESTTSMAASSEFGFGYIFF